MGEAEAILVVACTGTDGATGRGQLSLFFVPTDAPGLVAQPLPVMPARRALPAKSCIRRRR